MFEYNVLESSCVGILLNVRVNVPSPSLPCTRMCVIYLDYTYLNI